ncbi:MAG: hypothetical protein ABSH50_31325 [Bryobacteraceae bacterium]|jgi:hypothetical protein
MDPTTELIARNIADNIILYLGKTVAPDDAELRAAAAMNVAAVLSRHAQMTEDQTIELLRRCIEADKEAQSGLKTKKPAKKEGQE